MSVGIDTISVYTSSDLLFVALLHNVGGNFLFNTACNVDVRLSICLIRV